MEPGDTFEDDFAGTGSLEKEQDVWVFRTGQPLTASTTNDLVKRIREERDIANLNGIS